VSAGRPHDRRLWSSPPGGTPVATTPFAASFSGERRIDTGGHERRLSTWQLVLHLSWMASCPTATSVTLPSATSYSNWLNGIVSI
jgi:hypothetical protein